MNVQCVISLIVSFKKNYYKSFEMNIQQHGNNKEYVNLVQKG